VCRWHVYQSQQERAILHVGLNSCVFGEVGLGGKEGCRASRVLEVQALRVLNECSKLTAGLLLDGVGRGTQHQERQGPVVCSRGIQHCAVVWQAVFIQVLANCTNRLNVGQCVLIGSA